MTCLGTRPRLPSMSSVGLDPGPCRDWYTSQAGCVQWEINPDGKRRKKERTAVRALSKWPDSALLGRVPPGHRMARRPQYDSLGCEATGQEGPKPPSLAAFLECCPLCGGGISGAIGAWIGDRDHGRGRNRHWRLLVATPARLQPHQLRRATGNLAPVLPVPTVRPRVGHSGVLNGPNAQGVVVPDGDRRCCDLLGIPRDLLRRPDVESGGAGVSGQGACSGSCRCSAG